MAILKSDLTAGLDAIADKHDKRAVKKNNKNKGLNMRVTPEFLAEIQAVAEAQGFPKYQRWVRAVLEEAVDRAKQEK